MQAKKAVAAVLIVIAAAAAVWKWQTGADMARLQRQEELALLVEALGLEPLAPPPRQDRALVALGEALFFEPELSGNRDVSCATCHDPALGLGDELPLSIGTGGVGVGKARVADADRPPAGRNAIALFNSGAAGLESLFWDGRVEALPGGVFATPAGELLPDDLDSVLAAQAMFPVTFRDEMRGGWYDVAGYSVQPGTPADEVAYEGARGAWHDIDIHGNVNELAMVPNGAEYLPQVWEALMARLMAVPRTVAMFEAAYPDVEQNELGFEHAANALAAYESEAFAVVDTPWDRFVAGERDALTADAVAGGLLFFGEAGCGRCHSGALLSDGRYHNIGAPQLGPGTDEDAPLDYGRWAVTGEADDRFAFRTPPLRNVALTGPWLHNGAYDSLEDVVRHHLDAEAALRAYDGSHLPETLQRTVQNAPVTLAAILETLDPALQEPVRLSEREVGEIVAFLEALGSGD